MNARLTLLVALLGLLIILVMFLLWWWLIFPSPGPDNPEEGSTPTETTAAPQTPASPPSEADNATPTTQEKNLPKTGGQS